MNYPRQPSGAYVTNGYDAVARLTGTWLKTSGHVITNAHTYGYTKASQRTGVTNVSNNYVSYTYDTNSQLKTAIGKESGGSTNRWQEQFGYAYDAAGNLKYRTNHSLLQTFSVDNQNQLTTVAGSGKLTVAGTTTMPATNVTVNTTNAERYADRTFASTNHSWTSGNNTFTAIAKDGDARIDTNALTANLSTSAIFQYDSNGNLTNDGRRVFAYDDENQLTNVMVAGEWKSEFSYDGKMRRRVRQEYTWRNSAWVKTNEVRYVYDGNLVLQERDQFNVPTLSYTRGIDLSGSLEGAGGIGGLLAFSQHSFPNAQHFYYHADGNGNVTCLIDSNQRVAARYLYDPFGNTLSASGPAAELNLYRFSSKELHAASGLVYYLYRFYEPSLQRWPNRDPIEEQGGINLFQYGGNDPVSVFDSWGMDPPSRKRDPDDGLPPERPISPKPPKDPKDYGPKEPGQQYEEIEEAKRKCQEAIKSTEKSNQKDKEELERLAEEELKRRALERLLKEAQEEEARRNRFRVRLKLPNKIDFSRIR